MKEFKILINIAVQYFKKNEVVTGYLLRTSTRCFGQIEQTAAKQWQPEYVKIAQQLSEDPSESMEETNPTTAALSLSFNTQ